MDQRIWASWEVQSSWFPIWTSSSKHTGCLWQAALILNTPQGTARGWATHRASLTENIQGIMYDCKDYLIASQTAREYGREERRHFGKWVIHHKKTLFPLPQHTTEFIQKVAIACAREMEALRLFINTGLPCWVIVMMNAWSLHESAVQLLLSNSSRWSLSVPPGM